jgi:D-3-phosphoglycerate dehydrogenase
MNRILVTEAVKGEAMDRLREETDLEVVFEPHIWNDASALTQAAAKADAIIVRNQTQVTAELIAAAPNLKIIARAGAGLDNIDTDAATAAGVVVSFAPNENSLSVAELAMGLFISLARNIPSADKDIRNGNWNRALFTGSELSGKTLGIVGIGRIGTLVAQRAKAFDMKLVAHDKFADPNAPHFAGLDVSFVTLDELLSQADFITVHLPLLPDTRRIFNKDRFAQMKPSAFFVNTSRGEVVDETALAEALQNGVIAGAGLDVRETEPPSAGDAIVGTDKAVLTPHIAAFTNEAQERVVAAVCRDSAAVLRGQAAEGYFNFPVPKRT